MKKKILCLAMTVIMAAGVHTTAFAKDSQGADRWQVNFTGGKMDSNFKSSDVTDELANIQPGDSIELKVQLKNSDSTDTDWYMTNEVIQTLEDAQSSAEGGAYEYKLTYVGSDNAEKVLYDSSTVGGEGASKAGEGLKQIDNSTQEYFYLGRLASNNTGTVHLTVGVEGETQGNGYQLTLAKLRMNFAVEKVSAGKTITKNKIVKTTNTVKTGDTARILLFCFWRVKRSKILLQASLHRLSDLLTLVSSYNYARKSNTMKQIHRTGSVIMYKIDFNQPCHIHFIGIGGISMSGLAEILLEEGFTVSGSDNKESALTDHLSQNGATVFYGQKASNIIDGIDLVVYTAAIHEDNEEFAEAKRQNLPMLSRAELLGQLMTNYKTPVAISGTHGKTTTTSMLSHIALAADLDPTISVGGILKAIEGNIRVGVPYTKDASLNIAVPPQ